MMTPLRTHRIMERMTKRVGIQGAANNLGWNSHERPSEEVTFELDLKGK